MRIVRAAVYTLALASANLGFAGGALAGIDPALVTGAMEKLVPSDPRPLPDLPLVAMDDATAALPKGKWQLVNLWATWCVPCREEMPALEKLAVAMPDLQVTAVAVGPNPVPKIKSFLDEVGVSHIGVLRDPNQQFARAMGVLGLPVTVIVNPEGQEVARLIGGADWGSAEAMAVLKAAME